MKTPTLNKCPACRDNVVKLKSTGAFACICGVSGPCCNTVYDAAVAWNRLTGDDDARHYAKLADKAQTFSEALEDQRCGICLHVHGAPGPVCPYHCGGEKAAHEDSPAIIAALTAAPEKPRVDVRKVCDWYNDHFALKLDANVMAAALRAAGVEVVE